MSMKNQNNNVHMIGNNTTRTRTAATTTSTTTITTTHSGRRSVGTTTVRVLLLFILLLGYIIIMLQIHRLAESHLGAEIILPTYSSSLVSDPPPRPPPPSIRTYRSGADGIGSDIGTVTTDTAKEVNVIQEATPVIAVIGQQHKHYPSSLPAKQGIVENGNGDDSSSRQQRHGNDAWSSHTNLPNNKEAKEKEVTWDKKKKMTPTTTSNKVPILLSSFYGGGWDNAPIVVEEYKLLFFSQPKVACTVFKQLLRRMMHIDDWWVHKEPQIPHDPNHNGLKYLYHYPPSKVMDFMTSPNWTRAIFVRDPKERLLSAYLDKAVRKNGTYITRHCCRQNDNTITIFGGSNSTNHNNSPTTTTTTKCSDIASQSLVGFLQVIDTDGGCCCDPHWRRQSERIDPPLFWKYINFVGHFENLALDTKRLLQKLKKTPINDDDKKEEEEDNNNTNQTAWYDYGASGWGIHRNESIFAPRTGAKHETNAYGKLRKYYTSRDVELLVENFYQDDYDHPLFNFTKYRIVMDG